MIEGNDTGDNLLSSVARQPHVSMCSDYADDQSSMAIVLVTVSVLQAALRIALKCEQACVSSRLTLLSSIYFHLFK